MKISHVIRGDDRLNNTPHGAKLSKRHGAEGFYERAETLLHMAPSARYCYEGIDVMDEESVKKHLRPGILEPFRVARDRLAALAERSL